METEAEVIEIGTKAAYEAYCEAVGGVAFNGDRLPTWEQQSERNPRIADAWRAAMRAGRDAIGGW